MNVGRFSFLCYRHAVARSVVKVDTRSDHHVTLECGHVTIITGRFAVHLGDTHICTRCAEPLVRTKYAAEFTGEG